MTKYGLKNSTAPSTEGYGIKWNSLFGLVPREYLPVKNRMKFLGELWHPAISQIIDDVITIETLELLNMQMFD